MRDAPERIWADRQRISKWVEGTWTDIEPGDPLYAEYLRIDIAAARVEALQAEVERLREDITSGKAIESELATDNERLRTEVAKRNKIIAKAYVRVSAVVHGIIDEGDRVYFGSSNDADVLRDLSREWDDARILKEDIRTSEEENRNLRAEVLRLRAANREAAMKSLADLGQAQEALDRATAAEAEAARLRADLAVARGALEEAAAELDGYYRAEWGLDHPLHHRNLKFALDNNCARAALARITQEAPE